jgi:hypothetical protein
MRQLLLALWLACAALPAAHAHLMPAQKGTLNVVDGGAFLVLSVPVTALGAVDDDGDGKLSMAELRAHAGAINAQVKREVQLRDAQGPRPLDGVMLTLSPPDTDPAGPVEQLVVMGRFVLAPVATDTRFSVRLFGTTATEQAYQITLTQGTQKQVLMLSPQRPAGAVFPSAWAVLADYVVLGAEHIVTGWDHMLFLLVVLAAGLHVRQVVTVLTCFTLGHAVTLSLSAWGVVSLPSSVVEPAIVATIVFMAVFDQLTRQRQRRAVAPWRLTLVFGCALIHGLGLASALSDIGLDSGYRLPSLAGFNLGIELAQVAVVLSLMMLVNLWRSGVGGIGTAICQHLHKEGF